jgi:hypothetical protein
MDTKSVYLRSISTPILTVELFTKAKIYNESVFVNKWTDIKNMGYIHNEILFSHKENEILLCVAT